MCVWSLANVSFNVLLRFKNNTNRSFFNLHFLLSLSAYRVGMITYLLLDQLFCVLINGHDSWLMMIKKKIVKKREPFILMVFLSHHGLSVEMKIGEREKNALYTNDD